MSELRAAKLAVHRCKARLEFVESNECGRYAVEHARQKLSEAITALRAVERTREPKVTPDPRVTRFRARLDAAIEERIAARKALTAALLADPETRREAFERYDRALLEEYRARNDIEEV